MNSSFAPTDAGLAAGVRWIVLLQAFSLSEPEFETRESALP
jgi:hypothetical protein